jgi:hypothetical protein
MSEGPISSNSNSYNSVNYRSKFFSSNKNNNNAEKVTK